MWKLKPQVRAFFLLCLCFTVAKSSFGQLSANFSSSVTSGCAALVVSFQDESAGNPTSWKWDLGNGTISFFKNPSVTYFNPGTYTIKLVVSNGSQQDSIVKTRYLTVYALPTINFGASDTIGCFPLPVKFTDLTNPGDGSIVKWLWDFGDGSTDTIQNPSHTYTAMGNYNVSLQAKNSFGCVQSITRQNYVRVTSGVKANFTFTAPNSCSPSTPISFTNQSTGTGALTYLWNFGDGTTSAAANPVHTYGAAGSYTVSLLVKNSSGCSDSLVKYQAVVIGSVKASISSADSICAGSPINFTNSSTPSPSGAWWSFGDGNTSVQMNPVHIYNTPGIYQVKLVSDFGACKDSVTKKVVVLTKPTANYSNTNSLACKAPLTVNFQSSAPGAVAYKWFFGDGDSSQLPNPAHTYLSEGDFDVTLIVTNSAGCSDTLTRSSRVKIHAPKADITNLPQEGCLPYTFSPTASVQSVDPVASYQWDFGDGSTATGLSPVHVYTTPGTYQVKLVITTAGGCTDSVIKGSVRVGQKPNAAFIANPRISCSFQPIRFSDLSTGSKVDQWLWKFGDGGTSTEQDPTYFYQDTGVFHVTLFVWSNGCRDSVRISNYIQIKPPIARFSDSSGCDDRLLRKFIDKSIGASYWFWEFGDGATSTQQNPFHTYSAAGTYTVTLTVKNDTCEHTLRRQINIIAEKADFKASDTIICKGSEVIFATKNINTNNIAQHFWDFGDGVQQSGSDSIRHTYTAAGSYSVSLVITDINGCRDTMVKNLYIRVDGPTANFNSSLPGACLNTSVQFVDASVTDGTHSIQNWIWNFGDGSIDTLSSGPFNHLYTVAGNYTVTLKVTDSKGCVDSVVKQSAIVISSPKADFTTNDTLTCTNAIVGFKNLSTGPALRYTWEFGDTKGSGLQDPPHSYSLEGFYSVRLFIEDQYGCRDSITKTNYIHVQDPVAQFSISDSVGTCPPLVVNFTNQSKYFISHQWDFGDGTKSTLQDPVHFYTYPGTYFAKLTVVSVGGCTDTFVRKIIVRGPQGDFNYDKTFGCVPTTIQFVGTTKDNVTYIWDFNDGETIITNDSVIDHTYMRPGDYLPKMILRDPGGCQVPIRGKDTIHIYGVQAGMKMSQQIVCDSGKVFFRDTSLSNDRILTYDWDFGDGKTSSLKNPSHTYNTTGNYPVRLVITTEHGCTDTVLHSAPLKIVSSPRAQISGDTESCVPALMHFSGMNANPDTSTLVWQWNFPGSSNALAQNPDGVLYPNAGSYNVELILINSSNCADTTIYPVVVHPLPVIDAGSDQVICKDQSTTLKPSGGVRYTWTAAPDLSCTNCSNPVAQPNFSKKYFVQGENSFGCKSGDSVNVIVKQPFTVKAGPGDTLCKGEAFTLSVTGAELYQWYPSAGLDDASSANPKAKPDTTTSYYVVGRDDHGCFTDTGYVPVIVYPYPLVDAGQDQTLSVGSSITLKPILSADVKSIRWSPEKWLSCAQCPAPVASPKQTTTYKIDVANQGGCRSSDIMTIFVICEAGNLYMPNTFSPNGDGINDVFYPRGKGIYGIKNLRVFNRWGEIVFEQSNFQANDISRGWTGIYRNKPASQDVYVYTIDVICENNVLFSFKGNIALIR